MEFWTNEILYKKEKIVATFTFSDKFLDDAMTEICDSSGDMRTCLCGRTTFN